MVQILANTSTIPVMQKRLSELAHTLEQTAEGGSLSHVSTVEAYCLAQMRRKRIYSLKFLPTIWLRDIKSTPVRVLTALAIG